jgi:hypothetical protein
MAAKSDAPSRGVARLAWLVGAAWVATLAWDALIDTTDDGDPPSSVAHELVSVGPIACVAVAMIIVAAIGIRRSRGRSTALAACALLALSGAVQLAAFAWAFVLDTTTRHEDGYVGLLLVGIAGYLAAAVWLTALRSGPAPVPSLAPLRPERPGDPATRHYLPAAGEGRIERSWRLTRTAWAVVRRDSTMLVLAAASLLFSTAAAAILFWVTGLWQGTEHTDRLIWVSAAAAWPLTFGGSFLSVALAAAAAAALEGRRIGPGEALRVSVGRIGQIAAWSLLVTGVGVVLQEVAERVPLAGRMVAWIAGTAWSLVTFFAIPILALEGCTATACVTRSARLIKRRWGEGITGTVVITAWVVVVAVPAGALIGTGLGVTGVTRIVLIAIGAITLDAAIVVTGAVRQVFAVALYRYATAGETQGFREPDLARPFTTRRRWRR